MDATHAIETPASAVGAVSILRVIANDLDPIFTALNLQPLAVGQIRLASLLGLDDALIARFDHHSLLVMPHGGIGITRAISQAFIALGIELAQPSDPQTMYPEAEDIHEARMLQALASAPSPAAVDVLLDQPARWRLSPNTESLADSSVLNRLLVPPLVVVVGRANIGKSSLVNALAGTSVAMVSDLAGTTRDHVGVMLDLSGLAVRWVDTPGIDERVVVGEELDLAAPVIRAADLIVHAVDHSVNHSVNHKTPTGELDPRLASLIGSSASILRVGVRSDLGPIASPVECSCSSHTGQGIETLATTINHRLIPPQALADPRPWRFWDS
ncbi:MAG: 50S ribosome-binding GTPase [Phycisphaerales bacterium]|nr:50S ribosome-binding GTPase [Phycisphaerales bacterium]